jgi:hypothetical protein
MKPIGSATTTILSRAATGIGTQHGAHGSVTPYDTEKAAAWLAAQEPDTVDSAAALRASSRGVELRVVKSGHAVYDGNGNQTGFVTYARGCEVSGDEASRQLALDDLIKFSTPAPVHAVEEWLAELSVIVARRGDDQFGDELRLSAYVARLGRYPADVVKHALLRHRWKFWPTWTELEDVCERMFSPRKHMMAALRSGPKQREPEWRKATDEEKRRAQDLVDAMFPSKTPEERKAAVDEAMKGYCMKDVPL